MSLAENDPIDVPSVKMGLETVVFGRGDIRHLSCAGSTNDIARELAKEGAPEGSVVIADSQTKGRGRLGRTWHSPPGTGLYFSLILRPLLDPAELSKITLLAGIAVAESIEATSGLHTGIKWPNDVLLSGKKVAGILTELYVDPGSPCVILGIGINVHTRDFPPELQEVATSLSLAGGQDLSRVRLLRAVLKELERGYELFKRGTFRPILDAWREKCVLSGAQAQIRCGEKTWEGTVIDVDQEGALLLKDQAGKIQRILSGEVLKWEKS